jgi:hypothetical protein
MTDKEQLEVLFTTWGITFVADKDSIDCHTDTEYGRRGLLACFDFDEDGKFKAMDATE